MAAAVRRGLRRQRGLPGPDRQGGETVQGERRPRTDAVDLRRRDRVPAIGWVRGRGRNREARANEGSGRGARGGFVAGRRPNFGRGQAAAQRNVQRHRVPPVRQRETHRLSASPCQCRRADRRRLDPARGPVRQARTADRRRQHPGLQRVGRSTAAHRRRVGHRRTRGGDARSRYRRRRRGRDRQAHRRQDAHRAMARSSTARSREPS